MWSGEASAWVFGGLFVIFLVYVRLRRKRELQWIETRFDGVQPIINGFGVLYFGRESDTEKIRPKNGFLLVLPDRLFFRSRTGIEWEAPADRLIRVSPETGLPNKDFHQSVMVVEYYDSSDLVDRAAFKVPYMPEWIRAIDMKLMRRPEDPLRSISPEECSAD
jgi:hypothetical protein